MMYAMNYLCKKWQIKTLNYDYAGIGILFKHCPAKPKYSDQCTLNLWYMMTSSNGNIFRVTGHLCGEFTGPGEFPWQRPVTRSFNVFLDLCPNKRLSKQSWGWWFETPLSPLWRHCNVYMNCHSHTVVNQQLSQWWLMWRMIYLILIQS